MDGSAFVQVRMEPATGFDFDTGTPSYTGPNRISGASAGLTVVREVVSIGDFEGILTWAVGLSGTVGFKVATLAGPSRLVVDFQTT